MQRQTCSPATLIGCTARSILDAPGFRSEVRAVVTGAAYVGGTGGGLFWVSPPGSPPHPRALLAPFHLRALAAGMEVAIRGDTLVFGGVVRIDLSGAPVWRPLAAGEGQAAPLAGAQAAFLLALRTMAPQAPPEGMALAIPLVAAMAAAGGSPAVNSVDPFWNMAAGPVRRIALLLRGSGEARRVTDEAEALIGLGPGLTPSGDDFVGGLLFGLRCLASAYPGLVDWDDTAVGGLIERARGRTNSISHVLLLDYARGHGPAPLHDAAQALLSGRDLRRAAAAMSDLARIGRTSGWDVLAGLLTSMLATCRARARAHAASAAAGALS